MNLLNRFNGPVRFAIGILIIGALFKIMHWPAANIIMSAAFILILLFYAFKIYKKEERIALDFIKLILIGFWCIQGVLSINHLPFAQYFKYGFWASFILWFLVEYLANDEKHKMK